MSKRVTVMIEDDLLKKLHEIQAKQIRNTSNAVSFTSVLNDILRKGLKIS